MLKVRMKYGLKPETIDAINGIFGNYAQVKKVILYGSRAKGNYHNGSDIDLTMIGNELDVKTQYRIENDLDYLMLPYKIDLSLKAHIESQELLDYIARVGLTFYKS
jgi:predicted nucleotidyltransferase